MQLILPRNNKLTGLPSKGRLVAGKLKDDHNSEIKDSKSCRYFRICCTGSSNSKRDNQKNLKIIICEHYRMKSKYT